MPAFNKLMPTDDYLSKLPVWEAKKSGRQPVFQDYAIEASAYWPAIAAMLNSFLDRRSNQDLVVEGAQLNPELVRHWLSDLGVDRSGRVKALFLSHGDAALGKEFEESSEAARFNVLNRDAATTFFDL